MAEREDFERLALPLMRWLRATRNPHTSIIITSSCAELVSGEMSVVESDERTIECVCAEIDPSDRPCLVCECSTPAHDATERHGYIHATTPPGPRNARVVESAQDGAKRCAACVRAGRVGPCIECPGSGVPYGLPATHTGGETRHWTRKPAQDDPEAGERCPEFDCVGGTFIHENGMKSKCGACNGTGKARR